MSLYVSSNRTSVSSTKTSMPLSIFSAIYPQHHAARTAERTADADLAAEVGDGGGDDRLGVGRVDVRERRRQGRRHDGVEITDGHAAIVMSPESAAGMRSPIDV
ncbi:MAG: hypothetical protein QM702_03685 [Rubrivivax sp.]